MPVAGMTEINQLPRKGKLRLGTKVKGVKNGKEYTRPEKSDHFIFDPDDESIMPIIQSVYGDNPKNIDIMFASDNEEEVFPQYMKRYSYNTLACKGDNVNGKEFIFETQKDGSTLRTGEKEVKCQGCQYNDKKRCKAVANLQVMLPKIPGIGIWQIDTSSRNSIIGINAGIRLIKTMYKRLSGIPLKLLLTPKTVNTEGRAKTVYVMSLSWDGTLEQAMLSSKSGVLGLPAAEPKALMPLPAEEKEEELVDSEHEEMVATIEDEPPADDEFIEEVSQHELNQPKPEEIKQVEPPKTNSKDMELKRKLLYNQVTQLEYDATKAKSYLQKAFHKSESKDLTEGELDLAICQLGKVIGIIDKAKGVFERKELETYAKTTAKVNSLMELSIQEMERLEGLIERSGGKKG